MLILILISFFYHDRCSSETSAPPIISTQNSFKPSLVSQIMVSVKYSKQGSKGCHTTKQALVCQRMAYPKVFTYLSKLPPVSAVNLTNVTLDEVIFPTIQPNFLNLISTISGPSLSSFTWIAGQIKDINKDAFERVPHIRHLNLRHNLISTLKPHYFNHLESLESLDLGENHLTAITFPLTPAGAFSALKILNLCCNSISVLESGFLQHMKSLKILDLHSNELLTFNQSLPPSVQFVDLSNNAITVVDRSTHTSVPNAIFFLSHNPLECHCDLMQIFYGYVRYSVALKRAKAQGPSTEDSDVDRLTEHIAETTCSSKVKNFSGSPDVAVVYGAGNISQFLQVGGCTNMGKDMLSNRSSIPAITSQNLSVEIAKLLEFGQEGHHDTLSYIDQLSRNMSDSHNQFLIQGDDAGKADSGKPILTQIWPIVVVGIFIVLTIAAFTLMELRRSGALSDTVDKGGDSCPSRLKCNTSS